jgi:hypothetical protein
MTASRSWCSRSDGGTRLGGGGTGAIDPIDGILPLQRLAAKHTSWPASATIRSRRPGRLRAPVEATAATRRRAPHTAAREQTDRRQATLTPP